MKESTTVIGCDVHKEKITAAVLPPAAARPTEILTVENHPKAITRFVRRLAHSAHPLFVYEAGPCGYELQRHHVSRASAVEPAVHDLGAQRIVGPTAQRDLRAASDLPALIRPPGGARFASVERHRGGEGGAGHAEAAGRALPRPAAPFGPVQREAPTGMGLLEPCHIGVGGPRGRPGKSHTGKGGKKNGRPR